MFYHSWASSQVSFLWIEMDGHFHSSVTSPSYLFCRQDTLYVKDFVTGLVLTFPFWKPVEDLPTAKALEPKGVKTLYWHQPYFFTFSELYNCYPWQWDLQTVCRGQPVTFATTWFVWRFPWDSIGQQLNWMVNSSIECNPVLVLEDLFCDRRCPVVSVSPHY